VFGYTPNYLRVVCVLDTDVSVENQTLNTRLVAVEDGFIVGGVGVATITAVISTSLATLCSVHGG
jgi:LytS/YehU family sensor histidine kinase